MGKHQQIYLFAKGERSRLGLECGSSLRAMARAIAQHRGDSADLRTIPKARKYLKSLMPRSAPRNVDSHGFLASFEWRKLRMRALKAYGARCMCCGATPADGACINVDHIKPRQKYPHLALVFSNLQVLCDACNHGKGNWDETDWRPFNEPLLEPEQVEHLRDMMH